MEEIKPVVIDKEEFDRDEIKIMAISGKFRLSGFQLKAL